MAKPADAPGSPMNWFNKNAAKLSSQYPDEWVIISGKGVELHGSELSKISEELKEIPKAHVKEWICHFVPKEPF